MIPRSIKNAVIYGMAGILTVVGSSGQGRAGSVNAGWDLFQTLPGSTLAGAPLVGVPAGSFDFGPPIGVRNTGNADTIIRRLDTVTTDPGTTRLQVVYLALCTAVPVSFGGLPLAIYCETLRFSDPSLSSMTITNTNGTEGTFTSHLDFEVDIREGSPTGNIVATGRAVLDGSGTWTRLPPAGALEIPGVNTFLNGADRTADFWPRGITEIGTLTITSFNPPLTLDVVHVVSAAVPEPTGLVLLGMGVTGIGGFAWRRRKQVV
jgi:hypothetical protein